MPARGQPGRHPQPKPLQCTVHTVVDHLGRSVTARTPNTSKKVAGWVSATWKQVCTGSKPGRIASKPLPRRFSCQLQHAPGLQRAHPNLRQLVLSHRSQVIDVLAAEPFERLGELQQLCLLEKRQQVLPRLGIRRSRTGSDGGFQRCFPRPLRRPLQEAGGG